MRNPTRTQPARQTARPPLADAGQPPSAPRKRTRSPDRNGAQEASGLELPHDRDESTSMTGGVPSEPMRQAHRDLARGLQDTDKGPVLDRTYQRLKKAG